MQKTIFESMFAFVLFLFACLFVCLFRVFLQLFCSIFLFFMTIFWFVSAMSVNGILTITCLNRNFNLHFVSSSKTWKKLQSLGCHCWVQSTFWIIHFFSIYRLLISAAVLFVLILSMFYLDMGWDERWIKGNRKMGWEKVTYKQMETWSCKTNMVYKTIAQTS